MEFTQGWANFKLNMMNKIFHFLKLQEFITELFFIRKKWNFEPIGNFAYTTEFFTLGKALLILIQTGNHKY